MFQADKDAWLSKMLDAFSLGGGGIWVPIAASAVAINAPADTNNNVLASIKIPGGYLGLHGRVRVMTEWNVTNNANSKTLTFELGGTLAGSFAAASLTNIQFSNLFSNRGAFNSQKWQAFAITTASAAISGNGTTAIDTSADTTLAIKAQKATGGDTITLESYLVELLQRP